MQKFKHNGSDGIERSILVLIQFSFRIFSNYKMSLFKKDFENPLNREGLGALKHKNVYFKIQIFFLVET